MFAQADDAPVARPAFGPSLGAQTATRRSGTLTNILLGIVGAVVGGFIVRMVGFHPMGGLISSIVTATLGAVILIAIARKLK